MVKSIYKDEYKKILGSLKKARMSAELTQIEVAKILNKPQSYVSKIEIGERKLDVMELLKLSKIYNKKPDFFLGHAIILSDIKTAYKTNKKNKKK